MASRHRVEQRVLTHRGRTFRFISYEGKPANVAREEPATDPAWFLVNAGHRWEVMPHQVDQEPQELDQQLTEWLEENVFT